MTADEVKDVYSMRDIVERYGFQPNRAGFITCPFHPGDNQASLKVYKNDFHCFACGAHGDIFTFVQEIGNITFKEAFESLGGSFRGNCSAHCANVAMMKRQRELKRRADEDFNAWRMVKLDEVCRLLLMLDVLETMYEPMSESWSLVINKKQLLEEEYQILAFGTKEDQEGLRG